MRISPTAILLVALSASGGGCAHVSPDVDLLAAPDLPPTAPPETRNTVAASDTLAMESFATLAEKVLLSHPEMEAARRRVRAAEAARVQAGAWTNPVISADVEGWGLDHQGFDESEITISAGFPLDVAGVRGARVSRALAERETERARHRDTRRLLLARVRDAVHAVRAGRERERLASERLRLTEETAAAIVQEVDAGKAPPLEQIRAEVDRETARAALTTARSALREARLAVGTLEGGRGAEGDVSGALRGGPLLLDRAALREELAAQPAFLARAWEAEAARRRERETARARWPQLEADFGLRRYVGEDRTAWVTGLGLELPLWDRGAGAMNEARELAAAAALDAEASRRALDAEFDLLLNTLDNAGNRLALYRERILPQAREGLDIARLGFEGGKFGYLDLLEAQRALLEVQSEHSETLITFDEALSGLESLLDRDPRQGLAPEVP